MRDLYYVSIFNSFFFNTPFPSFSLFLFPSFPLPLSSFSLLLSSFSLLLIDRDCNSLANKFILFILFYFFFNFYLFFFFFFFFFLFVETASWIENISFGKF